MGTGGMDTRKEPSRQKKSFHTGVNLGFFYDFF